jgi:hypothetical protein
MKSETAPVSRRGGRAFWLGPRPGARVLGTLVTLVALAALGGALLSGSGSSAAHRSSSLRPQARYGGLPSWLPKPKVAVNRIVNASYAHPVLAIQGDAVSVHLAGGRVLATAVGPEVPEEGHYPVPAASPCTFIVTFSGASRAIALSAGAFSLIDELDHVFRPRVTAIGGGPMRRRVLPGHSVSLEVHAVLPTGDGGLRWLPDGTRALVTWDFEVEVD